jgi:hypothetical protein
MADMVKDETALRAAMRDWLTACEAVDAAMNHDREYAASLPLAETAALARLRLHQELAALGWTPPRQAARQP